jgi:hypothetical protein
MYKIPLTRGRYAIVSRRDFVWLKQWNWYAERHGRDFYAVRTEYIGLRRQQVYMHREILDLKHGDRYQVDHRNRDTLDNRRSNLRIANHSQNGSNSKLYNNNTSGYRGVTVSRDGWMARIVVGGETIFLGRFSSKKRASAAYREAAIKYHGEFRGVQTV